MALPYSVFGDNIDLALPFPRIVGYLLLQRRVYNTTGNPADLVVPGTLVHRL